MLIIQKKYVPLQRSASYSGLINPLHVEVASIGTVPERFALFYCRSEWRGPLQVRFISWTVFSALPFLFIYIKNYFILRFKSGVRGVWGLLPGYKCCRFVDLGSKQHCSDIRAVGGFLLPFKTNFQNINKHF